jgi:mono/diheme cytochrome c family protein
MTRLILLLALLLPMPGITATARAAADAPPTLELQRDGQIVRLTPALLLARPDLARITIPNDVAYKRAMDYRALPLRNLLRDNGFTAEGTFNFLALDGFAVPIDAARVFNEASNSPQPWLAVEEPSAPWPALSPDGSSAGPFYLVWRAGKDAPDTTAPPEHWPFQIAVIEQTIPPEQRYPQILPDLTLPKHHPAWEGFALYKTHCIACHKINGGGDAVLGPDLNLPHNPTEYFTAAFLKKLIRNPAQVRKWNGMKMPGFDAQTLSDEELDALLAYLNAMVKQRQP